MAPLLNFKVQYVDPEFDTKSLKNFPGNYQKIYDVESSHAEKPCFINDGFQASDIQQRELGDCWWLSSLASLAHEPNGERSEKAQEALRRVVQEGFNTMECVRKMGMFCFKFFHMGDWKEILIDEFVPNGTEYTQDRRGNIIRQPGTNHIKRSMPSSTNEWWVPLCEKAYAKFNGSYQALIGGVTSWALTELTGGIAAKDELRRYNGDDSFFELLYKIQNDALICTGNYRNDRSDEIPGQSVGRNGLVPGHAYSVLRFAKVKTKGNRINGWFVQKNNEEIEENKENEETEVKLVRVRNPWGRAEWNGDWSDESHRWEEVADEVRESINIDKEDGAFWMSFEDWVDEFEVATICFLPTKDLRFEQKVSGVLEAGVNSLRDQRHWAEPDPEAPRHFRHQILFNPKYQIQAVVTVDKPGPTWIQFLVDCSKEDADNRTVCLNLFKLPEKYYNQLDRKQTDVDQYHLMVGQNTKVTSSIPKRSRQDVFDSYSHNGYYYDLPEAGKYLIIAHTAERRPKEENKKVSFVLRTIQEGVNIELLGTASSASSQVEYQSAI